jgi:hypothetical protein
MHARPIPQYRTACGISVAMLRRDPAPGFNSVTPELTLELEPVALVLTAWGGARCQAR